MRIKFAALISMGVLSGAMAFAQNYFQATPINDLGPGVYLGQFQGGLYENGSNIIPADHEAAGLAIVPTVGNNGSGKFIYLGTGMSTAYQNFGYFVLTVMPTVTNANPNMVVIGGAQSGYTACAWAYAVGDPYQVGCYPLNPQERGPNPYDNILTKQLTPAGLTESQVEVIYIENCDPGPTVGLPSSTADAYVYERWLGMILRAAKTRYPNLKIAFLTSRFYAGYTTMNMSPEPYAYETAFTIKWIIQAQINQERGLGIDPVAGDLSFGPGGAAPYLVWGPYVWASGTTPRSDGMVWCDRQKGSPCHGEMDYNAADLTHPSTMGMKKVGDAILSVMENSEFAEPWFLASH